MADRTSAALFGRVFGLLAENPTNENKAIAKEIAVFAREYDFNNYQMDADDALILLGLAYKEMEDGYEVVRYNFR